MQTDCFLVFEWKLLMKSSCLIKSTGIGYCTAETCVYICALRNTPSLSGTGNVLLCRAGIIGGNQKQKGAQPAFPSPDPFAHNTAIKPWSQISWEGGRAVSFLLAALSALLPWADKAFLMSGWFTHSRINFFICFSDWQQSGASVLSQYCSQQWMFWWWPVKHKKHSLPSCWKEHRDRTGMARRKSGGISASPWVCMPRRPLHHSISFMYLSS